MDTTTASLPLLLDIATNPLGALISMHPNIAAGVMSVAALFLVAEQVYPHSAIKANSTLQVIINIARAILRKKG